MLSRAVSRPLGRRILAPIALPRAVPVLAPAHTLIPTYTILSQRRPPPQQQRQQKYPFHSTSVVSNSNSSSTPIPHPQKRNGGRWLSDMKTRLGKCIFHGLAPAENKELSAMMDDLTENWREYVAGSEGYLMGEERRGLWRHAVVWGDMDSMYSTSPPDLEGLTPQTDHPGHVNNVIYTRYAESGRINWMLNFPRFIDPTHSQLWEQLWTPRGNIGLILRSIKVDYKFVREQPMEYPDKVTIYHKINTMSEDAFTLDAIILSEKHQRPTARSHEDIVLYSYKKSSKAPLPEFMKVQFEKNLELQESSKKVVLERMKRLEGRVEEFEKRVMARKEMK